LSDASNSSPKTPQQTDPAKLLEEQYAELKSAGETKAASDPAETALLEAQLAYVTDLKLRPIEFFYPIVADYFSREGFLQRAYQRNWAKARERTIVTAEKRLQDRLADQIVQKGLRELGQAGRIRELLVSLSMPQEMQQSDGTVVLAPRVEPKNLEGCVAAFIKLSTYIDDRREVYAKKVGDAIPDIEHDASTEEGPLEHEDAVETARKVLQLRLKKQEQRARLLDTDEPAQDRAAQSEDR
jgi:hypothetical protein